MHKKIITAILLAVILMPATAKAITPGYGAQLSCEVWREGSPEGNYCDSKKDVYKRLYELEVVVSQLQNQNAELKRRVDNISTNVSVPQKIVETKEVIIQDPDNSRVEQLEQKTDGLEKRVSSLENAVKFLAEKVMAAIMTTLNLLKDLISKF